MVYALHQKGLVAESVQSPDGRTYRSIRFRRNDREINPVIDLSILLPTVIQEDAFLTLTALNANLLHRPL
jgi:hypothetical protein